MDSQELRDSFDRHHMVAQRFAAKLVEQTEALITSCGVSVAVPLESRVKSLESISEKRLRKPQDVNSVIELVDFVGVRAILLFRRDAEILGAAITKHFTVLEVEDTSSRLGESEFGYQSHHYQVRLPSEWLTVPSFAEFAEMRAEIQVRTAAQHIWAAASHILQYKQDQSVPAKLRRSIYRVSALLETVDLEFERLLDDRREYVEELAASSPDQPLDVDSLKEVLNQLLPATNKGRDERYAELLDELLSARIQTTADLTALISEQLDQALAQDRRIVQSFKGAIPNAKGTVIRTIDGALRGTDFDRIERGVFYSYTGLIRYMLKNRDE